MDVKSAIDWVIEKIGFRSFSDEQVSYDFIMFAMIVVSAIGINPGHNRDFENKCGYSIDSILSVVNYLWVFEQDMTLFSRLK